jgi:DNA polymerase-3 subunit epsilon
MAGLIHQSYVRSERLRFRRAQAGRAWSIKDLPQFYYHQNFCNILNSVEAELGFLLNPQVSTFIKSYKNLSFSAQCVYVRMSARKARILNTHRFNYPEISDLADQFSGLERKGFIRRVLKSDLRDYLTSLTKPDLAALMSNTVDKNSFKKSWKKDRLINIAVENIDFNTLNIGKNIWVRNHVDIVDYIIFLHSGHTKDGLQQRTLQDLGLVRSPKSDRKYGERFETRESAEVVWFFAKHLKNASEKHAADAADVLHWIEDWPNAPCHESRRNRDALLYRIGRILEKRDEMEPALRAYSHADNEICNERIVRLRYKMKDTAWVENRLIEMIENPSSDTELTFAQDFYARKFNNKRTSFVTDMLRDAESVTLDEAFKHQPEKAAAKLYRSKGLIAVRTENQPWRTLFGLLFWDEIFPNKTDTSPTLALKDGTFYQANKDSLEAKLKELECPDRVIIRLLKTVAQHYGNRQRIFRWGSRSLDHLKLLIEHSPHGALAQMLRLMAQNWDETKDGFPDLVLIENNTCRFIEVKAAGDVIRRHQLMRLRQLKAAGYEAEILNIKWTIDPDQTYVVVDVETTGGRPGLHRVTEIGAVKVKGGKIIDEWSSLINPQRSIPPKIMRLTGITQEMVTDAPIFAEIVDSFEAFMGDAIFAAHNVNFDYGFISAEFQMVDRRFRHTKICTCAYMRKLYPGHSSYSLKNLCRDYNIDLTSHHRALCDAKAAARLLKLINEKRLTDQDENGLPP